MSDTVPKLTESMGVAGSALTKTWLLLGIATVWILGASACLPAGEGAESGAAEPLPTALEEGAETDGASAVLPANNGREVKGGLVFSGQITEAELRTLAQANYRVLDLRGESEGRGFEESAVAEEVGLSYQNVPVDLGALGDPATHAAFGEALLLDAETSGPLVVHCASGNRVAGLYYAFLVEQDGLERPAALQRAREVGLTSQGVQAAVEAYLDRDQARQQ